MNEWYCIFITSGHTFFSIKASWLLCTFAGDGQASEYSCKATYRDTLSENSCWEKSLLDWEAQDHRTTYSCSCKECQSWGLCGKWCIIFYFHYWIPLKIHYFYMCSPRNGLQVGFDELGGTDDFSTEELEERLAKSQVISFEGEASSYPTKSNKTKRSVRQAETADSSDSD